MAPKEPTEEFIQLITQSQSRLYAYAFSLLGDRQEALDVMQETNIVLWRKSDQFQMGTNFGAWMLKIAYYQVLARRRKQNKQELFVDSDYLEDLASEVETSSSDFDQKERALQLCLEKLPNRQRDIVRRRYSEGYSINSVAEQLNVAASAIKQTLFRARSNLINCVQYRMREDLL
ncbi:sigma-70 family RNA polymerase sigma factor [Pelagicoccus mobilis]|uniref:Sigma-70 family RNA polymerase sigma factor n=1 Tax=Pelagicoccus mobilis TaxID=415221 RepID=A0A934VST9_9BACT|nr:sigma-70 family RNA polymerase sigma factor [Pelagicoccus mobilis]MBK1879008.1 sigma-70 family RNA polymerase sigma factor [Pelagicoccus mobilis]